jgi:ribosomal protein S18 acetylase RimI-like enzyme
VINDATFTGDDRVRRAQVEDAPALTRLRAVMFDGTGIAAGDTDAAWQSAAETWFRQHLAYRDHVAAFVIDEPGLGPISAAVGILDDRPPGPPTLSGVRGYVSSVATDPRWRRHGYARACLDALLLWFRRDTAVEIVELKASPDGVALYSSLGFRDCTDPTLRLTIR